MLLQIDPTLGTPLFEQIAGQVRRAIAENKLTPGERLPAARELAASLDVNMHTVLRAYEALRAEGLLEVRRGRGVAVTHLGSGRARLLELARELTAEATKQGLSRPELIELLEQL